MDPVVLKKVRPPAEAFPALGTLKGFIFGAALAEARFQLAFFPSLRTCGGSCAILDSRGGFFQLLNHFASLTFFGSFLWGILPCRAFPCLVTLCSILLCFFC